MVCSFLAIFHRYNTRHIALKILYLGWDYQGFAAQEDTEKTIETALFEALLKTKLIESRETSNYHRCGRTDKGVSAFGQVDNISLLLKYVLYTGLIFQINIFAHSILSWFELYPHNHRIVFNN